MTQRLHSTLAAVPGDHATVLHLQYPGDYAANEATSPKAHPSMGEAQKAGTLELTAQLASSLINGGVPSRQFGLPLPPLGT